jgi:hypothetical protein
MGGLAAVAGQASPGGLSPETLAAIEELKRQNGGQLPMAEPARFGESPMMDRVVQGAVDRSGAPAPAPAPQSGGVGDMLMGLIKRAMESVAGSAPAQPAPQPPLLQSSGAGDAAVEAEKRRRQAMGQ